jgi:hypothetical protein
MRLAGHGSVSVSQRYVHPTPQAMDEAVSRLDRMNAASLESKTDDGNEQFSNPLAGIVSTGRTDTPVDTDSFLHPQVIEGRVAQLAEQLTLNQ